nr:hypothetical protein CFP56_04367 [Quercus suber]
MPFARVFERRVNDDLQASGQERGGERQTDDYEDVKKLHSPPTPILEEADDHEFSEKKEDRPPRFSTLFASAPPPPPPGPHHFESYPVATRKRRSGVYLPTPLFVLFVCILLFESTLLFAYTVIGLYANLPSQLVHMNTMGCSCATADTQRAVNIAPNFVMQQPMPEHIVTVTAPRFMPELATPPATLTSSSSSSSSTSTSFASSSTEPIDTASEAAAFASDVVEMLNDRLTVFTPTTTSGTTEATPNPGVALVTTVVTPPVVTVPPSFTATSVMLVTVDQNGSTEEPSTTTLVTAVSASEVVPSSEVVTPGSSAVTGSSSGTTSMTESSRTTSTASDVSSLVPTTTTAPTTSAVSLRLAEI